MLGWLMGIGQEPCLRHTTKYFPYIVCSNSWDESARWAPSSLVHKLQEHMEVREAKGLVQGHWAEMQQNIS